MNAGLRVAHGCELGELLHEGPRSLVHRCRRLADGAPLVMKRPPPGAPGERTHALVHERDILRQLSGCPAAIGLRGFDVEQNRSALLLEDVNGRSLRSLGLAGQLSPASWLELALQLTRLLVELHAAGVVHNDVSAANIVLGPERRVAKLVDFAEARGLSDSAPPGSLRTAHASLSYMSPERTGRLNRDVDPRSDLYSLGVVLFELLTGRLPFRYEDPRELVHAHVARQPPRASAVAAGMSSAFDATLSTLLSKDPERRHASALALEAELAELACAGAAAGPRSSRPPSRRVFRLDKRVYGQAKTFELLAGAYEAARDRARAVVIGGAPGSGKSALLEAFARADERRGFVASGSFDASSAALPHSALAQATASLVTQLLAEGAARLGPWKEELLASLGGTRAVLLEFCPRLRHLLPPQAGVAHGPPTKVQLAQAIVALLERAATLKDEPLCVLIDDVHLATDDSLGLLVEVGAACRRAPVLFVLTHLTDEATEEGCANLVARWRANGVPTEVASLSPLGAIDVTRLLRDSTGQSGPGLDAVAEVVTARTRGNPLFVRAFLESVLSEGLLGDGQRPDLDGINRLGVTANVAALLIDHVGRLSDEAAGVLAVAACIGASFEKGLLEACVERDVTFALDAARALELVLPLSAEPTLNGATGAGRFAFVHELVRKAALSRLTPSSLAAVHASIGRALLDLYDPGSLGDRVFEAARHLNLGRETLSSGEARAELAELNLRAARAAQARAAAAEALEFARSGVSLLEPGDWVARAELARSLHVVACEAAFDCADHETLSALAPAVIEHAASAAEASRVHWLEGRVLQARSQSADAIRTFCAALARLGVLLEAEPSPAAVEAERDLTRRLLATRPVEGLGKLPLAAAGPHVLAAEFLSKLTFFTYSGMSKMMPVVICRLVRLSLEHGLSAESANGFTFYGLLLALEGDRAGAVAYASVALEVAQRFSDAANLSQTYLYASYLLLHWKTPLADMVEPLGDAYRYGHASGSPLNTACSATTLCICRFFAGHELTRLAQDADEYRTIIDRYRQIRVLNWHEIWMQVIENLRQGGANAGELAGAFYDEARRYPDHVKVNDHTAIYNLNVARTFLAFLFRDYATALSYSERNRRIPPLFSYSLWAIPVLFLDALCALACCDDADDARRGELVAIARQAQERLTAYLPDNPREIEWRLHLVTAELHRVSGHDDLARPSYAQAVELSAGSGSPLDEALANEVAGRFELHENSRDLARQRLRTAHRAYLRWGAAGKAHSLEHELPDVLRPVALPAGATWSSVVPTQDFDFLDLASCLEASRALSSEIKLENLLKRLTTLMLETAGAQTACLLMRRDEYWVIEVAQSAEGGTISVLEALPPQAIATKGMSPPDLGVINYVSSTGETVLLQGGPGARGVQLARGFGWHGEGSVLSFAVRHHGETLAIVYLENRLTQDAFGRNALRVLEMLSAQAAVSLENARLYAQLELHVQARTRELSAKNDELEAALQRLTDIQQRLFTQEELSGLATIAGGLAHEIKNPLNFIANFAEGAVETAGELVHEVEAEIARFRPEKQRTLRQHLQDLRLSVEKVVEHAARANGIVNRMGPHAGGKTELQRADLNDLVVEALGVTAPGAFEEIHSDLAITTDLAQEPVSVAVVAQDIVRVVVNLLNNALYSVRQKLSARPRDYAPELRITTRVLGDSVELRVFDNGLGVPVAARNDVFVPFFTTKPAGEGSGLGLSISRDIVVRGHGGNLLLRSEEGEFAEFIVTLPVAGGAAVSLRGGAR